MIFFGVVTSTLFQLPAYSFNNYTSDYRPELLVATDLNNDGWVDLIVGSNANTSIVFSKLMVFFARNDGKPFDTVVPSISWPSSSILSIVVGDFDRDGKGTELGLCTGVGQVNIYTQHNTSDVSKYQYIWEKTIYAYEYPSSLIKGQFNDDALDDLAMVSSRSDTLQVILASFSDLFTQQIYLTETHPTSVARLHFNNDSVDDLAVLSCTGTVTIFIGTRIGIFHRHDPSIPTEAGSGAKCSHSLKVTDVNQDDRDDLIFIDANTNSIRLLLSSDCLQ